MRIGVFVSGVGVRPGFEHTFSGHTQLAIETTRRLQEAGHDPHLLVTIQHDGLVLPGTIPPEVPVHHLRDGRWRGVVGVEFRRSGGLRPLAVLSQLREIARLARQLKLDVLHLFGFERTAALGGMLRLLRLPCPVVVTAYDRPHSRKWSRLAGFADQLIATTANVARGWEEAGCEVTQVRHGVIRKLLDELDDSCPPAAKRSRVLFWRVLAEETGGDVCLAAYDRLAPRYPQYTFDLALRPSVHEMPGAEELAARHQNVNLFRFPYPPGVSLPRLVTESLCALFPFRKLTIEPQMAIVETLAAGAACIGSDYASIPELIKPGVTGELVAPGDVEGMINTLSRLLDAPEDLEQMCRNSFQLFPQQWHWNDYVPQLESVYSGVRNGSADRRHAG